MMIQFLPKFKLLRDQWKNDESIIDLSYFIALGNDWPNYLFLVEESKKIIIKMLNAIILSLMKQYNYNHESFSIDWDGYELFQSLNDNKGRLIIHSVCNIEITGPEKKIFESGSFYVD